MGVGRVGRGVDGVGGGHDRVQGKGAVLHRQTKGAGVQVGQVKEKLAGSGTQQPAKQGGGGGAFGVALMWRTW